MIIASDGAVQSPGLSAEREKFMGSFSRFALSACAVLLGQQVAASSPPNILWISCEDSSPNLGCYGDTVARTPNLDKLASQGVRFTRAFSTAPVCAPSRCSIITGMYSTSIGTLHMRSKGVPPAGVKCFTEYLRAKGYYCTNNVKTDYNFPVPVTAWDESSKNAHWRNRPAGTPFFSVFNFTITHESHYFQPKNGLEAELSIVPAELRHTTATVPIPPFYPDTPVVREQMVRSYDIMTAVDQLAGNLLKQLDEDGLSSNTLVVFFSDHGRGMPRGKRWLYDYGIRVPLLMRFPAGERAGTVREDMVSLMDLGPSMLSLVGAEIPSGLHGKDILRKESGREFYFSGRDRMDEKHDMSRAVRSKEFKYIRNFFPERPYNQPMPYADKSPVLQEMRKMKAEGLLTGPPALFMADKKPAEELFDLAKDPDELNNLADKPEFKPMLEKMRGELDKWMKETGDLGLIPEEQLQAKMRPGDKTPVTETPVIHVAADPASKEVRVKMECPTAGSSIAWKKDGPGERMKIYTGELKFTPETTFTLLARAGRAGYEDSDPSTAVIGR